MTRKEKETLVKLLDKLVLVAPCRGGACVGAQNCEFGIQGCYGESCVIGDLEEGLKSIVV